MTDNTERKVPPAPVPDVEHDLPVEGLNPLGTPTDVLEDQNPRVPLDEGNAQQVADTYNLASLGSVEHVSVSDVLSHFNNVDAGAGVINNMLDKIKGEDGDVQKQLITQTISNPNLPVDKRIALSKHFGISSIDLNAITRQAMHNANLIENSGDTPEAMDDREKGAIAAEQMPRNVHVDTPMPAKLEDIRATYQQTLNEAFKQANDDSDWRDTLGSMIPFRYQYPVKKIYNALGLEHEAAGTTNEVAMGNMLQSIRDHVESLDTKGKMAALDTVMRILKPNSGMFSDGNDVVTAHTLEEIFYKDLHGGQPHDDPKGIFPSAVGNLLPSAKGQQAVGQYMATHHLSGTQVLDNFTSLLDLAGLGSLAKSTLKLGTKWLPKSLMRMREVAPEMATKTAVDALDDESIRLRFPGMSKEDVIAASLPASNKALQEGGVNGLGEVIARQLDIRDRLLRISGRTNMSAAERSAAFNEIQQEFGDIAAKPTSTLHLNESVLTPTNEGVDIEAMFGRTKAKPFSSYAQAAWAKRSEIEQVFGKEADVQIVRRNPETKAIELVPKEVKPFDKGEYFLRAKDSRGYESAPTAYHSVVLGDKDVANLQFGSTIWKHLRGPVNLLSADEANNIRLVGRQRTEWNKLTSGLTHEVSGLSASQQRKLAKILKDGEQVSSVTGHGKIYGPSELTQMGLDQKGQLAYYAYRNAMDIMFEVTNRQVRNRMLRDGIKDIHTPTGRVGFAQPRTLAQASTDFEGKLGLLVHDPATNTFSKLDHTALEALYKDGKTVARLETPMLGKGEAEATHVIMDNTLTKAYPLPRQVMTKVEGYYPHMWNGNYVVHATTKGGQKIAMGLASNEADARAAAGRIKAVINNRKAAGKSSRFVEAGFDFDRSLSQDLSKRGKVMEDVYANMGGPVYGSRNGGDLRNFSKAAGDVLVDPIEAMQRGMEIVGMQTTKQELAQYMRQKLYNYARMEGVLTNPRVIPMVKEDLKFSADKAVAYNKAKAYMDSIDFMLNTRDAVDEAVSKFFLGASHVVTRLLGDNPAGKAIAGKLATRAAKGGDFMSSIMSLNSRITIASAPVAQAALQASQSLVMLGVSPVNYMKAVAQTTTVGTLIGLRSLALHGGKGIAQKEFAAEAERIAKVVGMEPKELIKVVDTIMDNGLVSAVSYHSQMRNAIRSAAEERMMANAKGLNKPVTGLVGRFARSVDAQTFGKLNKVGFEFGEDFNQIATFLTVYNRDKAKGIADLANMDYVKKLIGTVGEATGDMIPETGFTYQRGWFKAAMQFVAFQHKMMTLMLPQALGGAKNLTAGEKAGMAFAQFLLFGRRAAPHIDAIYRIVDSKIREQATGEDDPIYQAWNAPSTRDAMDGLIFDTAGNYVLTELFGEHPRFALADRFAPGGGSEFMMDRVTAIGTNPTTAIFGLAGDKMSKLYKYMKRVGDISLANVRGFDDVPMADRFEQLAKEGGANLFSTYNRYLSAQAALRMDGWLSSGGRLTEGFSGLLEANLYTQFGVMTKDRESLYQALDKYREEEMQNPLARQKNLDNMVDQYYTDFINSAIRYNKEATNDAVWGQLMDKWANERGLLFSVLDPADAEYINEKVGAKITNLVSHPRDSAEATVVERLTSEIRAGRFGKEGPDTAAYLNEAEFVRNNPRLHELVRQAWEDANADDYMERK